MYQLTWLKIERCENCFIGTWIVESRRCSLWTLLSARIWLHCDFQALYRKWLERSWMRPPRCGGGGNKRKEYQQLVLAKFGNSALKLSRPVEKVTAETIARTTWRRKRKRRVTHMTMESMRLYSLWQTQTATRTQRIPIRISLHKIFCKMPATNILNKRKYLLHNQPSRNWKP